MEKIPDGTRGKTLFPIARQAFQEGQNLSDVWAYLRDINETHCEPPFTQPRLRRLIGLAARDLMAEMAEAGET